MTHLIALLALVLCASGIGAVVLAALRFPREDDWDYQALAMAAGLGVLGVALGAVALAGLLPWAPWLVSAGAVSRLFVVINATVRRVRSGSANYYRPSSAAEWLVVGMLAAAAIGAAVPVTEHDSLAYPVPIVQHLVSEGQWRFWPNLGHSVYPLTQELLASTLMLFGSDRLGLVSATELVIAAALIIALARRMTSRTDVGPVAVIVTFGCPAAAFLAASAKEDLLVVMHTAAAALVLRLPPALSAAAAAGVFAGLSAGAKYTGIPIAMAIVACVPLTCGRDRRVASLAVATAAALLAGGLWYGVNLARFGNPVPPFMPSVGSFPVTPGASEAWLEGFGYGRGVLDFVLAPLRMTLDVVLFREGEFGGRGNWINPLVWLGAASILLGVYRGPMRVGVLVISLALYVVWFQGMQVSRLLLPAVVVLSVPAALAMLEASRRVRFGGHVAIAVMAASVSVVFAVGVLRAARYVENPATFLERETEHFAAIQWMNEHLDPGRHRVITNLRASGLLAVPWMNLGPEYQVEIQPEEVTTAFSARAALERHGFTHVFGDLQIEGLDQWLVEIYTNPASRIGGASFFRDPPTMSVSVFELR